jgi:hypothetical protein
VRQTLLIRRHKFDKVPAAERKTVLTELGGGLFPPRVVDALTQRHGNP